MHFKQLEIVGFKSFLNKTKLKFEPGVTAVVGPNGCGKSNIVDAIKWVLGTQSTKAMRSSSMQDVIFNGTEQQDAVNVAEVSLTLSNEDRSLPLDFDEVTISRRLYRSGESEYLINKTAVRLQDVRNLLAGTGMGTSSYSIVEQGRMDMVLSSKPEERRYVFEEASGITRYKSKKREALLKLERTKENLSRVNDIIHEVERQIRSIERQARKAERYRARFEELKRLDIMFSARKLGELSSDGSSLGEETGVMKGRAEKLASEIEGRSKELAGLRDEFNALMENLQNARNDLVQITSSVDKNRHVIQINRERIEELSKYVERLDWEIEEATERKDVMSTRLQGLNVRFEDVSARRREKEDQLGAVEENMREISARLEEHRREMQSSRERTVDIAAEQTRAKNELIKTSADIQNTAARQRRLKAEKQGVETEKSRIGSELNELESDLGRISEEVDGKEKEFTSFNNEFLSAQRDLSSLKDRKSEHEKILNEIKPRRRFLEKLISEREGVAENVKDIMKRTEAGDPVFFGVHGILSELVNVREGYEESIESVLGEVSHALVVEDRDVAARVASYLSEHSMESVNIIILEELRDAVDPGDERITEGTLDDIIQVLSAKEPYSTALKRLLSDTFVTVSADTANSFIRGNASFRGRLIGESGEVYKKGLRRTRNFSGKEVIPLFGRREKVREMVEEENRITADIESISGSICELSAWLREAEDKRGELEKQLREVQVRLSDISSRRSAVRERLDSLDGELTTLDVELEEEAGNMESLRGDKERCETLLSELEIKDAHLQEGISRIQDRIREDTTRKEENGALVSDLRVQLSGLRKEEENLSENLQREDETLNRMNVDVESKKERIAESGERIKALEAEIQTLGAEIEAASSSMRDREERIASMSGKKDELADEVRAGEQKLKDREKQLEELRDRNRDNDIRKKELEYKRNSIIDKVMDTYKVDMTVADVEIPDDINWEETTVRIDELRSKLDRMGEVSLGAVEEHKELEERFQFLTKQRDDLESGKDQLLQAIQKINRTTRKMFMETFEAIKKEFNSYFRMLFNGGKAELVLEDESNVLECGIDIIVRPPGKKLHNIMQLSGGEKAMTAIALIFAIFKVNPSPFCILDEIDAPLDESNIVRFCRVLQEFLKLSQFIVVTHNRMTIQLADVLYGITMEQKGVSKIVSVKFTEEKEQAEEVGAGETAAS